MEKHHILNINDIKDRKVLDQNRRTFMVGSIRYMFQGEVNASGFPKGVGTLYKEVSEHLKAHLAPGVDYALAYHGMWTTRFVLNGKGWYKNEEFTVQGTFRTVTVDERRQFYFHNTATVTINATGDTFEGKLTKGMQLDVGLYTYKNGTTYRGSFHTETRKTHYGTYVSNDPKDPSYTYTGNFVEDKKHGIGALVFRNGNVFNGSFEEDKPKKGLLLNYDAESKVFRYEGPVDDKFRPHGTGKGSKKLSASDAVFMQGEFKEGKFIRGKRIHKKNNVVVETHDGSWNGKKFEGTVKTTVNGQVTVRQGRFGTSGHILAGRYTHADGIEYIGKFHDGKASGKGIQIHKNGDVYSGKWKQDKKDGDFVVWKKQPRDEDGFDYKRSEVVFEKDTKKTTKSAVLKRKRDFDDFVRTQKRVCLVA